MKTSNRYILAPITFLPQILLNKQAGISNLINFGIAAYSKRRSYKMKDAARQALFSYYRGTQETSLRKEITELMKNGYLDEDTQYNGFGDGKFNPFELDDFLELLQNEELLSKLIVEHYQLHLASQSLRVSFSFDHVLDYHKKVMTSLEPNRPMVPCNLDTLFAFRDEEKDSFEVIQLVAFLAIKSILGKKHYVKTNFEMVLSRMMGGAEPHDPAIEVLPDDINMIYAKYRKRHHRERLMHALELKWNVVFYSNNMRGFYCSIENKMSLDELALIAESKKLKAQIAKRRMEKLEAQKKALLLVNTFQFAKPKSHQNRGKSRTEATLMRKVGK